MAYTPVNWQTGDTITAERLNRMDRGWDVETTELFNETVTTAVDPEYPEEPAYAQLAYSGFISADSLIVTFDGTEYTCPSIDSGAYGAPFIDGAYDFSVYPFSLSIGGGHAEVSTQTAGEHTIAARTAPALQTSTDFDTARGWGYVTTELFSETVTTAGKGSGTYEGELTYSQLIDASSITVTFDGTEYECPSIGMGHYGAPFAGPMGFDFSEFPFNLITSDGRRAELTTQTAGEHTIAVFAPSAIAYDELRKAIKTVADEAAEEAVASVSASFIVTIGTTTWAQVNSALKSGRPAFVWNHTTQRNQPDTYEFVFDAIRSTPHTVHTLAVSSGAVVVKTYQAASDSSALVMVTS